MSSIRFKGYHGTSVQSAKLIIELNYKKSIGDKEWLGDGVYFFIKGISSKPDEQAKKWAVAQSWNKETRKRHYKSYCVIKSEINVLEKYFLDLTKEDGVEVLNYLSEKFEQKITSINKTLNFSDGLLLNLARKEGILEIDVVKGNFYIKFARERKKRINLRTPNCTICAVFEPNKNIQSSTIVHTAHVK